MPPTGTAYPRASRDTTSVPLARIDTAAPAAYDRLKALERRDDPTNLFRLDQNISPD